MRDDVADPHTSRSLFLPPCSVCHTADMRRVFGGLQSERRAGSVAMPTCLPQEVSTIIRVFLFFFFFFPRRSCLSWPSSTMNGEHFDWSRRRSSCLPAPTFTNERGGGNSHSFACSQLMEAVIWRRKACPHVRILGVLRTIAHPFPTVVSNTKSIVGNRRWFQVFTQEKYIRNWGFFLWSFSRSIGNNAL